jgi:hypothetical protein
LIGIADAPRPTSGEAISDLRDADVEVICETTDELGRPEIAVGYTYLGVRHELIFDPSTSAILGERLVQVDAPMVDASPAPDAGINLDGVSDPGTLLGWSSVVATGIVDSTQERT